MLVLAARRGRVGRMIRPGPSNWQFHGSDHTAVGREVQLSGKSWADGHPPVWESRRFFSHFFQDRRADVKVCRMVADANQKQGLHKFLAIIGGTMKDDIIPPAMTMMKRDGEDFSICHTYMFLFSYHECFLYWDYTT